MRKVILYIAVSLDGFIAKADGSVDWLHDPTYDLEGEDFGYTNFYASIDTTLMGNETYKTVLGFDVPFPYPDKKNFVFTRTKPAEKAEFVEFISGDIVEFTRELKAENGKNIWLIGGGKIDALFLKHNLIDEMILTIIPRTLGAGIPLFDGATHERKFTFRECSSFKNGFVQLTYSSPK